MLNTLSDITPRTQGALSKKLLPVGQAELILGRFGQVDVQPLNSGRTHRWRRYELVTASRAPLIEGVTEAGQKPRYTDVLAYVEEYGEHIEITNVVQDTHEDPILNEMGKRLVQAMAELTELNLWDTVSHGASVIYQGSGIITRGTVAAAITVATLKKAVRLLKRNRAKPITKMMKNSADYGTVSIDAAYIGVCHDDLQADLAATKGWTPVEKYAEQGKRLPGEIGKNGQIRFCCSSLFVPAFAEGASGSNFLSNGEAGTSVLGDVYSIVIFGEEAFGVVPLAGKGKLGLSVINPGTATKDDPHGQRGLVGIHIWDASAITNQEWIVRVECLCTTEPPDPS